MTRTALILAAACLLPLGAQAQDFTITGPDLAGRATVTPVACRADGTEEVSVALTLQRFGKDGAQEEVTAAGTLTRAGVLAFSYTRERDLNLFGGLTNWLSHPLSGEARREARTETVSATLRRDRSRRFVGEVGGVRHTWTRRAPQDDLVVLAIPGLSTNNWNRVGIPYLDENLDALRARGLEARRLEIKTEDSVANNAAFIAREVRAEAARGKRVIILAHSKGGTDATAALALYPDLVPMVVGVVAIQPVYAGSPVADFVSRSRFLVGSVKVVFEQVFKGSKKAVTDLTRENRARFVAEHPYPADRVPTVVIRSTFDRRLSRSVLYANQKVIERATGQGSDGMVTLADQIIPGAARTIDYQDLDHFEPGVRGESPHVPVDLTNAAMDALLPILRQDVRHARPASPARRGAVFDRALGE